LAEGFIEACERATTSIPDRATRKIIITLDSVSAPGDTTETGFSEDIDTGLTEFAINPDYFLAAIKAAGKDARISVKDETSAIVIHSEGFEAVVAPIRISQ
jgi:hypothetical protein